MTEMPSIRRLAAKGQLAQVTPDVDFDWSRAPRVPVFMSRRKYQWLVAQFIFGEEFASETCAALRQRVADPDARVFLETQELDERRHAAFYRRYLKKLAPACPPSSLLAGCYGRIKAWDGAVEAVMLACHILLEGRYLRLQTNIPRWSRCRLFREISAAVARDEARHYAFGRAYLQTALPQLPLEERLAICRWLGHLWEYSSTSLGGQLSPLANNMMSGRQQRWRARQWRQILDDLQAAGLFTPAEQPMFSHP